MKIIYDFGANHGQNIDYYLSRADIVVAVEANPAACDSIRETYEREIKDGKVFVENCVLLDNNYHDEVPFYIHKTNDLLSTIVEPENLDEYEKVSLHAEYAMDIIRKYGFPHYIKIDLEDYDANILRALFEAGIKPQYVSAESKSIEVFALMVAYGYDKFKLVDGKQKNESAGPFGEDISTSKWSNANDFFKFLALVGLGWKDIHCKRYESSIS